MLGVYKISKCHADGSANRSHLPHRRPPSFFMLIPTVKSVPSRPHRSSHTTSFRDPPRPPPPFIHMHMGYIRTLCSMQSLLFLIRATFASHHYELTTHTVDRRSRQVHQPHCRRHSDRSMDASGRCNTDLGTQPAHRHFANRWRVATLWHHGRFTCA